MGDMVIETDIDALWRAVEENPADQGTRRVLADWYADRGDDDAADALTWMAAKDVWATCRGTRDPVERITPPGSWAHDPNPWPGDDPYWFGRCALPATLFGVVPSEGGPNNSCWHYHSGPAAADRALIEGWRLLADAGRLACWAWVPVYADDEERAADEVAASAAAGRGA